MNGGLPSPLDLPVAQLLERWPASARLLRELGLGGCLGCVMAPFETLRDALRIHGVGTGPALRGLRTLMGGAPCRRRKR